MPDAIKILLFIFVFKPLKSVIRWLLGGMAFLFLLYMVGISEDWVTLMDVIGSIDTALAKAFVTTSLAVVTTFFILWCIYRLFYWNKRDRKIIYSAYAKVTPVYQPEYLAQDSNANMKFMATVAKEAIAEAIRVLDLKMRTHPEPLNTDSQKSLKEWHEFLLDMHSKVPKP